MNKAEIFIRKNEQKIAKGIYKILQSQKNDLVDILQKEKKSYSTKGIIDDVVNFFKRVKSEIPNYLYKILQPVMQTSYKKAVKPFAKYLNNSDIGLAFSIETEPCVKFLKAMQELHLSQRKGSISKTTENEILELLREGIKTGKSYGEIGKEIKETDPFVFSRSRGELIAIQETGKAYGWANYEPALKMKQEGYKLQKKWTTSHDEKVRDSHNDNAKQGWIDIDEKFAGTGDDYAPSTDFRCRCTSTTKIIG